MTEPTPVPNDTGGVSADTVARESGESVTTSVPAPAEPADPGDTTEVTESAGPDGDAAAVVPADHAADHAADHTADRDLLDQAVVEQREPHTPEQAAEARVQGAHAQEEATAPADGDGSARTEPDSAIHALWQEFATEPSQRTRDRLVLHYAPLVKYVAGRVGTGLPTHVDVADLIQSGIFGLVDAIEKFDPDRGLRFETYAMQRIRGAILDDLRSQDWVPRVVRSRAREVERTLERLGARLGRTPTDAEVAAEMGISAGELRDLYGQLRLTSVVALETLVAAGRESEPVAESLPDEDAVDPAAVLVDRDNRKQLADAIAQLSERDRVVVSLYYFESLTLAEIGKVLGVTESRVSQLHTRAVLRLRAKLQEQAGG